MLPSERPHPKAGPPGRCCTRALQGIHTALRPGGHLVFETRRPERRAWEEWAADVEPVTLNIADIGLVERCQEVTDVRRAELDLGNR
jgi:hypothetical protein